MSAGLKSRAVRRQRRVVDPQPRAFLLCKNHMLRALAPCAPESSAPGTGAFPARERPQVSSKWELVRPDCIPHFPSDFPHAATLAISSRPLLSEERQADAVWEAVADALRRPQPCPSVHFTCKSQTSGIRHTTNTPKQQHTSHLGLQGSWTPCLGNATCGLARRTKPRLEAPFSGRYVHPASPSGSFWPPHALSSRHRKATPQPNSMAVLSHCLCQSGAGRTSLHDAVRLGPNLTSALSRVLYLWPPLGCLCLFPVLTALMSRSVALAALARIGSPASTGVLGAPAPGSPVPSECFPGKSAADRRNPRERHRQQLRSAPPGPHPNPPRGVQWPRSRPLA